jgi:MoaA/NifB/PqqE/SkfB family radical SAM enzyme
MNTSPAAPLVVEDPATRSHVITTLPILVLMPHNRCNCRCMMCDIWRIRETREITRADLEPHLTSLRALKVQWIVFSGGEPLMHSDLAGLARWLRGEGIRTTLLTAGLLLEKYAASVTENIDDVIVSLDGPSDVHDKVRGIPGAYRRLARGVQALRLHRSDIPVQARCTIQRENVSHLRSTVRAARDMGLDSISFLAADVESTAFNHETPMTEIEKSRIAPDLLELDTLAAEIERMIDEYAASIDSGFIRESPEKLRAIVRHFRAQHELAAEVAPRCDAPWVSAVIESSGDVRPCFFHPALGNIYDAELSAMLNGPRALQFRRELNIASNPICRRCVCSLDWKGRNANSSNS